MAYSPGWTQLVVISSISALNQQIVYPGMMGWNETLMGLVCSSDVKMRVILMCAALLPSWTSLVFGRGGFLGCNFVVHAIFKIGG